MKDPEEKEIMAYVAGLIDGDGNICVRKGSIKNLPLIQFHNSVKSLPIYLNKLFGGTVACDKPKKEGYKPIWKWMLQGKEGCVNFIEKVEEYLVLKKDSAQLLMEFLTDAKKEKDYYNLSKELNLHRKLEDFKIDSLKRQTTEDSFFWAYVAGIMDTDGSFSVERSVRKPEAGNRQKNNLIKYRPRVSLTMVSDRSVNYILSNCCYGSTSIVNAKTALRGSACRWSITARTEVIEFLKKCIPFLHIKSIQAVNLLRFCRNYSPTNGVAKVPEEEMVFREECYKQMMELNKNTPS